MMGITTHIGVIQKQRNWVRVGRELPSATVTAHVQEAPDLIPASGLEEGSPRTGFSDHTWTQRSLWIEIPGVTICSLD